MNDIQTWLKELEKTLNWLNGLPALSITFLLAFVCGFVLRRIKRFPNEGIPVAVVLFGGVLNTLLADPMAPPLNMRLWVVKNTAIGMLVGFMSWAAYRVVWKPLQKRIPGLKELDSNGNTATLSKEETKDL